MKSNAFLGAILILSGAICLSIAQKKSDPPKISLNGGGNGQAQQANIGVHYPNGAGGQLSYGHAKGYGHDVGVDAMVPIWSKETRRTQSTLNIGGGVSHHFGGPGGSHLTDKRVGLTFVHRF